MLACAAAARNAGTRRLGVGLTPEVVAGVAVELALDFGGPEVMLDEASCRPRPSRQYERCLR